LACRPQLKVSFVRDYLEGSSLVTPSDNIVPDKVKSEDANAGLSGYSNIIAENNQKGKASRHANI